MPPILPAPSTATRSPGMAGDEAAIGSSKLSLILKGYQTLFFLGRNPPVHALLQHIERQRPRVQYIVVKRLDIELRTQSRLRPVTQLKDFQLSHFVSERLSRPCNVSIYLSLNVGVVDRRVLMEVVHHLLARPVLRVHTGIDTQPYRSPHVVLQPTVVAVRVFVKAHILAQPFAIQPPTLSERCVVLVLAKLWESRQLLRNRNLQVVTWKPFVIRYRLYRRE